MNARIIITAVAAFALGATAALVLQPSTDHGHSEVEEEGLYTCGMHPQVIQEGPGDCPICGMKLTPMSAGSKADAPKDDGPCTADNALFWRAPMDPSFISERPGKSPMGMELVPVCSAEGPGNVVIDNRIRQSIGVRTALVKNGPLERRIRTVARVEPNERKVVLVTTKFSGWIERLYVNETGQFVKRGAPLFEICSPDVVAGQQEYLLAFKQGASSLAKSARDRLKFWDFTERQIAALERRGSPAKTFTVYSPATGYVAHKNAVEGVKVSSDKRLFEIVDLSTVWVQADVYEYELPWVRLGQKAELELSYVPGRKFVGTVQYIYPYLNEKSRTVKVRLEFKNPGLALKPGMFGTVRIHTTEGEDTIQIPAESIIRTGDSNLVFVDLGKGHFKATEIQIGEEGEGGIIAVRDGLRTGQRIVTSGQFLLDSESQLKEAVAKMIAAATEDSGSQPDDAASRPASQPTSKAASQPSDGASEEAAN